MYISGTSPADDRDQPDAPCPFDLPATPTPEQIETAQLLIEQHRPDQFHQCPTLTCAVGPKAAGWPCSRWRWSVEILRRAGIPVHGPDQSYPGTAI